MRWWRCAWSHGELCDVERVSSRMGEHCKDLAPVHVCFVYALNIDHAIAKARAKHPEFPDAQVEFKEK